MARWGLSRVIPKCFACTALLVLMFVDLEVLGFRASPWVRSTATVSRETCVALPAGRGDGERREGREPETGGNAGVPCSRMDLLRSMGLVGSAVICGQVLSGRAEAAGMQEEEVPTVGKITKAGIKYFDFRVGEGPSPRWGQDCIIRFTMYGRSTPDEKLIKIQSSDNNKDTYLFKHGNGFQIKGMEEGMHSMRVGGKRRVIMPQSMGYSVQGLGPYPADPRKRDILVEVLTSFEKTTTGELVMDIELLDAFDDEADQGYYEDTAVTPEQLQDIVRETGRFSGGQPMEKLPGQLASPMEDTTSSAAKKGGAGLPGQLGKDVMGG
ncbi:unnamed protein product [Ectocarpus sp. 4 AP-2014]